MVHHFKLCMQNYVPLCTISQLLVHGEPFGSLVQNNAIGFFLMKAYNPSSPMVSHRRRLVTVLTQVTFVFPDTASASS